MIKYVYNPSPLYTLLFKGGSLEIKPQTYYEASEQALPVFEVAKQTGQVQIFDDLSQIPEKVQTEPVIVISQPPIAEGLTEEQLREFKEKAKQEQAPETSGVATKLGGEKSIFLEPRILVEDTTPEVELPGPGLPEAELPEVKAEAELEPVVEPAVETDEGTDEPVAGDSEAVVEAKAAKPGRKAKHKG